MRSLRARLLVALLGGMLIVQLGMYLLIYMRIEDEIDQLFDAELERSALAFASGQERPLPIPPPPHKVDNPLAGMVITVWADGGGAPLFQSAPLAGIPRSAPPGFSKVTIADRRWRLFAARAGNQLVIAAQPREVHIAAARQITLRTLLPTVLVLPAAALMIWLAITFGLRPLGRVTAELRRRSHRDLSPLDAVRLPHDIAPVVRALNELMLRLSETIEKQRTFIADAAHELLTPLTAVRLQSQMLSRVEGQDRRREALAELQGGVSRALEMARQLLTLARHDADSAAHPLVPVDMAALIDHVAGIHVPLAQAKAIALEVKTCPAAVHGSEDALNTLLANLIENAIKYTGRGGTVRVSVQVSDGEVCMEVEDSGPGIPPGERERVFDRFYRRLHSSESGSGLGLAIARDIAGRHHASIALGTSHSLGGLVAIVRFRALNEVTPPAVPTDDGASAARNPVSKSDAA